MINSWCSTVCGAVYLASCAAQAPRPDLLAYAYADALERGDVEAAWNMLGEEARSQTTKEDFARSLRTGREQAQRLARVWREAAERFELGVTVQAADGRELRLVQEGSRWVIDVDPLNYYSQATPRDALRSFIAALERARYDILLALSPTKWRKLMTADDLRRDFEGRRKEELKKLTVDLKKHLHTSIQKDGDHASLLYGDKRKVVFVHESDGWKIEDPNVQ